jgi:2-polyprenyl-3-methyl-5-hydroxy-6-metoxy-1,4-benzoquinol methylase
MKQDYKEKFFSNYYSYHTKRLYGTVSLDSISNQFKFWKYYFSEYLPDHKDIRILDAGCGNGGFVHWLLTLGYENTTGIDISSEMIEIGKSINIKNIKQADIFDHLHVNKNTYEIIFCRDVLEHLNKSELVDLFLLFFDALKSNGKLIIQVPNGFSLNYGKIFFSDFTHETLFSESVVNQLANFAGFTSVKIKEVEPVPHGLISTIRFILWQLLKIKYKLNLLIENGYSDGYFTQNIIAEIKK